MSDIVLIAPYKDLALTAQSVAAAMAVPVRIEKGLMAEGVAVARQARLEGAKVLISRGGTARAIEQASDVDLPVVRIPVTSYDLLRALILASRVHSKVAIVNFDRVPIEAETLAEYLGIQTVQVTVSDENEVDSALSAAVASGCGVVVGGVMTVRAAERVGVRGVLIQSGPEGVRQAIEEATRILWVKRQESLRAERIKQILDNVSDGIVAIDDSGRVIAFSASAERMTGIRAAEVVGKQVSELVPFRGMLRVLRTGKPEIGEVHRIRGVLVSMNRTPIMDQKSCVGVVTTFQEVSSLQRLERDVRQKLLARGHVAKFTLDDILGTSQAMALTIATARKYAATRSAVLILGETGTGKEMLAQGIHNASPVKGNPFVAVNCAALPETLLESELFGYVEGAFTGARKGGKPGLFELAHGGSIFLDEIAGMSLRLQARLLRVLQEQEVMRLGDDRVIPVEARVISASNRDLKSLVQSGQFQQDLYYRLNVLRLVVPPLRERREDIVVLANHFLQVLSAQVRPRPLEFSDEALELLNRYDWPGNVRELQNAVRRIVVFSEKDVVSAADVLWAIGELDFPDQARYLMESASRSSLAPAASDGLPGAPGFGFGPGSASGSGGNTVGGADRGGLRTSLRQAERRAIVEALQKAGGNKTRAARMLGVNRVTVWRKLRGP